MKKHICYLFLLSFVVNPCQAQLKALNVGDDVNGTPVFRNVINGPGNLSLTGLRGKLVILDFWTTGCSGCINSIPHLDSLQRIYNDRLQIILVNPWERAEKIEQRLGAIKSLPGGQLLSHVLPAVYGDTVWRDIFPHASVPHHVWISPTGKVIASTTSINTTSEHIEAVLDGQELKMEQKADLKLKGIDVRKSGLFAAADSSLRPIFYSGFQNASNGFGGGSVSTTDTVNKTLRRSIFNFPVLNYFQILAIGGRIIFHLQHEAMYRRPADNNLFDNWKKMYCYSYEIVLPMEKQYSLKAYMLEDANRFFGMKLGISAYYEPRKMNTYVLRKSPQFERQKIAKGSSTIEELQLFSSIKNVLKGLENMSKGIAFEDETGISEDLPFNVKIHVGYDNLEKMKKSLAAVGLKLSVEKRVIKVLVVSDNM